jgi:predicted RNA binding protein YcfA (HicA-like mRNA interferase family)
MREWRTVKAKQLLSALLRIGWTLAWQNGSHRRLKRPGRTNYTFAFHDKDEIGPSLQNGASRHAVWPPADGDAVACPIRECPVRRTMGVVDDATACRVSAERELPKLPCLFCAPAD